ncbi:hypothetical protein P8605_37790, partial [Streptomyces sp. T-3]|nr:hypothetical protein [Streptomyces sp. T-3]
MPPSQRAQGPPVGRATGNSTQALDGRRPPGLLLADPDEQLARKAAARFRSAGVDTLVCHDGAEALLQVGA